MVQFQFLLHVLHDCMYSVRVCHSESLKIWELTRPLVSPLASFESIDELVNFSHPRLLIHPAFHLGVVLLMDPGAGFHEQVFIMSM